MTKVILEHNYRVNSAFFSVDSRQVVTVSASQNVKIWRLVAAGMVLDNPAGTGNQKPHDHSNALNFYPAIPSKTSDWQSPDDDN
ncbi:hypothetical protein [Endozoicomonas acroporae]|uniref:hypothetical protein n=1 Tax=Endozoicomonas acroporae TaxID=1701104 RepID=UPI003D7B927F